MPIPQDLAFDVVEYRRRLDDVRAGMAQRSLDALLVFSPGSINYLAGLDDNSLADPTALIVPLDRDPILVLFWFEEGRAANSSWLADVRLYRAPNDPRPGPGSWARRSPRWDRPVLRRGASASRSGPAALRRASTRNSSPG